MSNHTPTFENAALYGIEDPERLTATTPEEAIIEYCDNLEPEVPFLGLTVIAYAPREIDVDYESACVFERMTEDMHDRLDEEYGDPDGDWDPLSESQVQAMKREVQPILARYIGLMKSWQCEEIGSREYTAEEVKAIRGK